MLSYVTALFILTAKQSAALATCVLRATTKKVVNYCNGNAFLRKIVHPLIWFKNFLSSK